MKSILKILKGVFNFAIGLTGLFMLVAGADFICREWLGISDSALLGFVLVGAVLVWQTKQADEEKKKKDLRIAEAKEPVYQSLRELEETIDELYRHYEIEKEPAEKLLNLVNKARTNTYDINRKFSSLFFKWEE